MGQKMESGKFKNGPGTVGTSLRFSPDEGTVRSWLRDGWDEDRWGDLVWVEAARGGTSGAPDVFVPIASLGYVPVELKDWEAPPRGVVRFKARPAQRRFHRRAAISGHRTAFLARVGTRIMALRGASLPVEERPKVPPTMTPLENAAQLRRLFHSDLFWDGY